MMPYQQVPLKKNHESQNGAKDGSSGEGGPEGATRPWVTADLAETAIAIWDKVLL